MKGHLRERHYKKIGLSVLALSWMLGAGLTVQAQEEDVIKDGIFISVVEVSGMTKDEAALAVEDYVTGLESVEITLEMVEGNEVRVSAGELGISWSNPEVVDEAMEIGTYGNVIQRYKIMKDLQHENHIFDLEFQFDIAAIDEVLRNKCVKFDQEAIDLGLKRVDGRFIIEEGQIGYRLDVETSIDTVYNRLVKEWDENPCSIALNIDVDEPRGSVEELEKVQDVLGSFTTSFKTSGTARSANVTNACELIDGFTLYPGEEFSTLNEITPFSTANGYYAAASYLNGKVVDSLGGGICQVSTTLYNAVLKAELEVTERYNHSMIVNYVDPSADAAIAESAGKDFKFINTTDAPVYIEGIIKDKQITFNIYGQESRNAGRKVTYVSEVIEVINPTTDIITADPGHAIGYVVVNQSAHIGYKAKLWKIVTENGKEVERSQVNYSSYKMTPRYATVGVATPDSNAHNEMLAAIGTGSLDHVKNVIALLQAQAAQEAQPVQ